MSEKKPLTALEWLRVTHADTLSGRRIEEAVAAARREGEAAGYGEGLDEGIALGRGEAERLREAVAAPVAEWERTGGDTIQRGLVIRVLRAALDES